MHIVAENVVSSYPYRSFQDEYIQTKPIEIIKETANASEKHEGPDNVHEKIRQCEDIVYVHIR